MTRNTLIYLKIIIYFLLYLSIKLYGKRKLCFDHLMYQQLKECALNLSTFFLIFYYNIYIFLDY